MGDPDQPPRRRWVLLMVEVESDVVLDVRPVLAAGGEPFGRIMEAFAALRPGQTLTIVVGFEPLPLYAVAEARGFGHATARRPDGDFAVTFRPQR